MLHIPPQHSPSTALCCSFLHAEYSVSSLLSSESYDSLSPPFSFQKLANAPPLSFFSCFYGVPCLSKNPSGFFQHVFPCLTLCLCIIQPRVACRQTMKRTDKIQRPSARRPRSLTEYLFHLSVPSFANCLSLNSSFVGEMFCSLCSPVQVCL